jgi:head-tail adaptor
MRAGTLKDIITLSAWTTTQDDTGFTKKTWEKVLTCKAAKVKKSADGSSLNAVEFFNGDTVILQTYAYPVIKEGQRVAYNGNTYVIKLVDKQYDRSYYLTLTKVNT